MNLKIAILPALAILSIGLIARAQFTPGSGGYTPVPVPPTPPRPVVPAPVAPSGPAAPSYSWDVAPPSPGQAQAAPAPVYQPAQPDEIRIVQQPTYDPRQYIETPQGLVPRLSDGQMGDLTASIALYPDPLLAEMLPATTYVEELTFADKWMQQHPGADDRSIDALPLDDSVKSVMHYPTVLSMMTDHLDWTQAVGISFLYQRGDLMDSVQRWRATAVAYGTLASSPQLDVFQRGQIIEIVPPPTQVVYVPVYDPQVVYVRPVRPLPARNYVSFAAGGFSLTFIDNDLDWRGHDVRVPVHHDPHDGDHGGRGGPPDRGGGGGGGGGGRGAGSSVVVTPGPRGSTVVVMPTTPPEKKPFVRDAVKAGIVYPDKIVTPQPDKKVIAVPTATDIPTTNPSGRGRGVDNGRGFDNGRGLGNGRGPGGGQ